MKKTTRHNQKTSPHNHWLSHLFTLFKSPLSPWISAFFFTCILLLPFLLDGNIMKKNDLDESIFQFVFVKEALFEHGTFPQWNPYVNQGIPYSADPLSTLYNPVVSLPLLFFPLQTGVKIIYFICTYLSIAGMYLLLRGLRMDKSIAFLLACTYAASGYLASRISAAHFFIIAYPYLPLFILSLIRVIDKGTLFWISICSFILALFVFSGDMHSLLYGGILLGVAMLYIARSYPRRLLSLWGVLVLFLFFSAIKILPFLQLPQFLGKVQEPYLGSQNMISIFYYMFLPVKPLFTLLGLNGMITPEFAWWEKIAFIGPVPLVGLLIIPFIYKKLNRSHFLFLILCLVALVLVAMPGWKLNPYYYIIQLVDILKSFHVPSRVFAFISVLVLLLAGITAQYVSGKSARLRLIVTSALMVNLIIVFVFFQIILIKRSPPVANTNYIPLLNQLRDYDISVYYIAQRLPYSQIPRYEAIRLHFKMIQNQALKFRNSPAYTYVPFDFKETNTYSDAIPKYLLQEKNTPLLFPADQIMEYKDVAVYKTRQHTPYVSFRNPRIATESAALHSVTIGINTIQVKATATQPQIQMILLESMYPGWTIRADGIPYQLNEGRFLSTTLLPGTHTYEFRFFSWPFVLGAFISLVTFSGWLALLVRYRTQIRRYFLDV
jgi:hypothetical protein